MDVWDLVCQCVVDSLAVGLQKKSVDNSDRTGWRGRGSTYTHFDTVEGLDKDVMHRTRITQRTRQLRLLHPRRRKLKDQKQFTWQIKQQNS